MARVPLARLFEGLAQHLLCAAGAVLASRSPARGNRATAASSPTRTSVRPSTGEPCAGDPPARFGGRGGRETGCPDPYPAPGPASLGRGGRGRQDPRPRRFSTILPLSNRFPVTTCRMTPSSVAFLPPAARIPASAPTGVIGFSRSATKAVGRSHGQSCPLELRRRAVMSPRIAQFPHIDPSQAQFKGT